MKILLSFILNNQEQKSDTRKATQEDIDRLLG